MPVTLDLFLMVVLREESGFLPPMGGKLFAGKGIHLRFVLSALARDQDAWSPEGGLSSEMSRLGKRWQHSIPFLRPAILLAVPTNGRMWAGVRGGEAGRALLQDKVPP